MACPLHSSVPAGKRVMLCGHWMPCPTGRGQRTREGYCVTRAIENATQATITTNIGSDSGTFSSAADTIRVKVEPSRLTSQPPSPPSLIHSPVYVQKALIKQAADAPSTTPSKGSAARLAETGDENDPSKSNSLIWALKQVDRSLDELETNPLPLQREIYELTRSPVGTATSSALSTAAKVTVAATKEAVKAAVPVGQWVVKEGAKAAVSLLGRAMAESAKLQQQQEGREGGGDKKPGKKGGWGLGGKKA